TTVPFGRLIWTGGAFPSMRGGSTKAARNANRFGHFRGFLAVATLPSEPSTSAYARSPRSPRSLTSVAFDSSPNMDLTGYRQIEATAPSWFCTGFGISEPPFLLKLLRRTDKLDLSRLQRARILARTLGQVKQKPTGQPSASR